MKQFKNFLLFAITMSNAAFVSAQIGINTTTPRSMLDVAASNEVNGTPGFMTATDGIMIPRVNSLITTTGNTAGRLIYLTQSFTDSAPDPDIIYPAGFYYYDGNVWNKVDDVSNKGQLVEVTESPGSFFDDQTGLRLRNSNPANYGIIGDNAVDLSFSDIESTSNGATGGRSFAVGYRATAGGRDSAVIGGSRSTVYPGAEKSIILGGETNFISVSQSGIIGGESNTIFAGRGSTILGGRSNTVNTAFSGTIIGSIQGTSTGQYSAVLGGSDGQASGNFSIVLGGSSSRATGAQSIAGGSNSRARGIQSIALGNFINVNNDYSAGFGSIITMDGQNNFAAGHLLLTRGTSESALGQLNTNVTAADNRVFYIGNGTDDNMVQTRSNALEVFMDGTINAPSLSIAEINTAGNTSLTTKEYVDTTKNVLPQDTSTAAPASGFGTMRYNPTIGRGEIYVQDSAGDGTNVAGWRAI
ncbi:MAG: hypothetical protein WBA16_04265 [Nonlabens sp.]